MLTTLPPGCFSTAACSISCGQRSAATGCATGPGSVSCDAHAEPPSPFFLSRCSDRGANKLSPSSNSAFSSFKAFRARGSAHPKTCVGAEGRASDSAAEQPTSSIRDEHRQRLLVRTLSELYLSLCLMLCWRVERSEMLSVNCDSPGRFFLKLLTCLLLRRKPNSAWQICELCKQLDMQPRHSHIRRLQLYPPQQCPLLNVVAACPHQHLETGPIRKEHRPAMTARGAMTPELEAQPAAL